MESADKPCMLTDVDLGKYAHIECERRWLLTSRPNFLPPGGASCEIVDTYFPGTRIRFRRSVELPGGRVVYKLTQKFPLDPGEGSRHAVTNTYLRAAEFELLKPLGGEVIRKRRYKLTAYDPVIAVDVFEAALGGLVIAEVEFEDDEAMSAYEGLPIDGAVEITQDGRFAGGVLCTQRYREVPKL